ncbi:MAG TPA: hypothetical protein VFK41_10670 [Nocardioidaceae bacterium]|nr:hypothetical protein [Nocardioidaceae bacterium]
MMHRTTWSPLIWSLVIAALVLSASLAGLLDPDVYDQETTNWATQAKGQDVGNLLAVAVLLSSGYGFSRGSHRAALVWLGSLLYLIYAYVIYSMAVHFNGLFLVYVAVLGLSSYAVMWSVGSLRSAHQGQPPLPHGKLAGWTSLAIGVLFGLMWLGELVPATLSGDTPQSVVDAGLWVNPVHVIDLSVLLPGFVIAGYLTLKDTAVGRFFVGPLLVFSVLMGASIVATMVLMTLEGFENTIPPLVGVSAVVGLSFLAAWRHLGSRPTVDTFAEL